MDHPLPDIPLARLKGRGARSNAPGRFEAQGREAVDDGWPGDGEALPPVRTEAREEAVRSILSWNRSPDLGFDRSINPYRGCEHGCIYCYARPSHAYLGLSPGVDFETKLTVKPGAAAALERELRAKDYRPAVVAIGTNTDAYQPIEKERALMLEILGVLAAFRHPVAITTKGSLIERDIDLLAPMAAEGLVRVGISITTLDRDLARRLEPRVPAPARRMATIRALAAAGISVRVMVSPIIPALTDHEIERILEQAAEAGAAGASAIVLRLPREVAGLFSDWLDAHVPDRAERVRGRLREVHGGQDYDPSFGLRMTGQGEWARLLKARFDIACKRLGLQGRLPPLRADLFRVPPRAGDQLSLF